MSLKTEFEFVLPRGYVGSDGAVHRNGVMRLATARDELEPLRDPTVNGADDPRLTILVLARVVERLGTLEMVTAHDIEGLFAADLAFLQDFYGVINFGTQEEYEQLLAAQQGMAQAPVPTAAPASATAANGAAPTPGGEGAAAAEVADRPRRSAIEEIGASGR